jgi:hypothetical protein
MAPGTHIVHRKRPVQGGDYIIFTSLRTYVVAYRLTSIITLHVNAVQHVFTVAFLAISQETLFIRVKGRVIRIDAVTVVAL